MSKSSSIRAQTLRPGATWERPTPDEVREMIRLTGLTGGEVAGLLGLAGRKVRFWMDRELSVSPIPYSAWALLAHAAGFGIIWCQDKELSRDTDN